jgi:cell division protein FtsZ
MGYAVMGTAIRSGENRAIAAAQAAMASPLLEAGAIDGARGILINISGASSLKLSEVNVASTLIQNAAHEDANIIFGAVLDETMGDNVKITVIATGFKQEHLGRRTTRASSESQLPRVTQQQKPSVPRFASEDVIEEEMPPVFEPRRAAPVEKHAAPEPSFLQPEPVLIEEVPQPSRSETAQSATRTPNQHASFDEPFDDEYARLVPGKSAPEAALLQNQSEGEKQLEHLDIPAFLRRPN